MSGQLRGTRESGVGQYSKIKDGGRSREEVEREGEGR
jgi:hypothetical protein